MSDYERTTTTGSAPPRGRVRRPFIPPLAGVALTLALAGVGQAWGATLTVCPTGCDATSLGDAVTAAAPGDTIDISAGTYEQGSLVIDKNLTITGAGMDQTTIQPPAGTVRTNIGTGWWEIRSGVTLNLMDLKLDGTGADLRTALYFAGNGMVDRVHVTNVGYTTAITGGTLHLGWGILQDFETSGSMALTVKNSLFDNFGGTAIQTDAGNASLNGDGTPLFPSTVVVQNSTLTCKGPPPADTQWLQYGVTATGGADVSVVGNTITDCWGSVTCTSETGEATDTYCGDSSAILAQSTFAKGTRLTAENNLIDDNFTGLYLDLFDFERGPWTFRNNSLDANDLDVYYIRDPQTVPGPVVGTNNWWGQDADPAIASIVLEGTGTDTITSTPWIANFVDDPSKAGQPGFWPLNITNWKVTVGTVTNGTLTPPVERFVADGAGASFIGTPNGGFYIASDTFISVGNCNGGGLTSNTWTTGPITDNSCVVSADFKAQVLAVDGVCGADDGATLNATPTNLCTAGNPSAVNGSGPWNWTCAGTVGTDRIGNTDNCSASIANFTVTGTANAGGTITPETRTVALNGVTSFTVNASNAFVIDSVTGCNGTLNGNLFTTGPVTADCTVTASFALTNTTTSITDVSPSPSAVGDLVTVSYTVTNPGSPNDVVTVTGSNGNSCQGTVGAGSCTMTFGTPGARTLIASYAPSGSAQASASAGRNHVVATLPSLATESVPGGVVGAAYSRELVATGGISPYSFSATGVPAGLILSPGGLLSGIPTTAGDVNVVVTVTDALGQTANRTYALNVVDTLAVTTTALPDGLINSTYDITLTAAGGTGPYTWSVLAGSVLPNGLTLDPTTGQLSGIPTDLGTSAAFTVQVQDSSVTPLSATQVLTLTNRAPDIVETSDALAVSGNLELENAGDTCTLDDDQTFVIDSTAYGADPIQPPDTTLVNGLFKITLQGCTPGEAELKVRLVYPEELPEGSRYWKYGKTAENPTDHWYVLPNAVIEGNTISFTIKDGGLGDDDLTANGSIIDPGGAADPWELDAIETGGPVDITLPTNVPPGETIATCGVSAGSSLPPGLSVNCSTGVLRLIGTPTTTGTYTFSIDFTDSLGNSYTEFYRITVNQGPGPGPGPQPVPALSEWSLIILASLMLGLVGLQLRRQQRP